MSFHATIYVGLLSWLNSNLAAVYPQLGGGWGAASQFIYNSTTLQMKGIWAMSFLIGRNVCLNQPPSSWVSAEIASIYKPLKRKTVWWCHRFAPSEQTLVFFKKLPFTKVYSYWDEGNFSCTSPDSLSNLHCLPVHLPDLCGISDA